MKKLFLLVPLFVIGCGDPTSVSTKMPSTTCKAPMPADCVEVISCDRMNSYLGKSGTTVPQLTLTYKTGEGHVKTVYYKQSMSGSTWVPDEVILWEKQPAEAK